MKQILVFKPPDLPPSLNGNDGLMRMHWSKRKPIKENFMWLIKEQKFKKIPGNTSLDLVNYGIVLMDWDNLCSRLKIVCDAMVGLGLLIDDNPDVIFPFRPTQERVKKKSDVRLEFIFTYEPHKS